MKRTRIKICGNTNEQDALRLAEYPVDALGFIVTKKDTHSIIEATLAAKITTKLPPFITSVLGISLQHNTLAKVITFCRGINPNAVQIQYGGTIEEIKTMQRELPWLKVIKVTNVFSREAIKEIEPFFTVVDMFLIDNKGKSKKKRLPFNEYLDTAKEIVNLSPKPVMLAGGLNSDNVEQAIQTVKPYAVDLISGVETTPGKKDFSKVEKFIKMVWETDKKIYG